MKRLIVLVILLCAACTAKATEIPMTMETAVAVAGTEAAVKDSAIKTIVAQTQEAMVTSTPQITPTISEGELARNIENLLAKYTEIKTVNYVHATKEDGVTTIDIEGKTMWASKNRQADASFKAIGLFAAAYDDAQQAKGKTRIRLTTFSVDGGYRYTSTTNPDTLAKLYNKQITYDEWVQESGAGFIE